MKVMLLAVSLLVLMALPVSAELLSFSGSLSSLAGGLQGTGFWPYNPGTETGTTLSWEVNQNQDGSWTYSYRLQVPRADASHMIIETSPDFTDEDVIEPSGPYAEYYVALRPGSPDSNTQPNPYMPTDLYGITFDSTYGTDLTFTFTSFRVPVWADFYAKCGAVGGTQNTIWNTGFTAADPLGPITDGSLEYHILAPDTETEPVPEPGTMCLMGLGLVGLGYLRKRRQR
jgi:hypothetical protein